MKDKGTSLVVDDAPADRELLVDTLTAEGCQALPAHGGELALASVAARPPDLILLDIRLPGLNGFEVCRRLQARLQVAPEPGLLFCDQRQVAGRGSGPSGELHFPAGPIALERHGAA
jgi:CheY-like chemotaxis protein